MAVVLGQAVQDPECRADLIYQIILGDPASEFKAYKGFGALITFGNGRDWTSAAHDLQCSAHGLQLGGFDLSLVLAKDDRHRG